MPVREPNFISQEYASYLVSLIIIGRGNVEIRAATNFLAAGHKHDDLLLKVFGGLPNSPDVVSV
jgi:hypothetical protein